MGNDSKYEEMRNEPQAMTAEERAEATRVLKERLERAKAPDAQRLSHRAVGEQLSGADEYTVCGRETGAGDS